MIENNQKGHGPIQETSGVNTEELQVSQNPNKWTKKKKKVFSNVQIFSLSAGKKKKANILSQPIFKSAIYF